MTEHNPEEPHVHVVVPEMLRAAHARREMQVAERSAAIDRLLDGLGVDGLMAMRTILNQGSPAESNQFFDGQIRTLLRRVHGVDPDTGMTEQEMLTQAGGQS